MEKEEGHTCLDLVKKDIEYIGISMSKIEKTLEKLPDQFAGKWVEKTFNRILIFIILATLAAVLGMVLVPQARADIANFITFNYNIF